MDHFENLILDDIVTPINVLVLKHYLELSDYKAEKSRILIQGFTEGFEIGYRGPEIRQDTADNIPLKDIGTPVTLWNKVMKEVKLGRFAGPFKEIPYNNYIQSPIGLVPKVGGKTHLIFHLSYNFDKNGDSSKCSLNHHTPKDLCSVKYHDLDYAIKACLELLKQFSSEMGTKQIYYAKTDVQSAFRIMPIMIKHRKWLIMKAVNPDTGETLFFVDKCLPFGSSISCAVFQMFSDALKHIFEFITERKSRVTNYLDDFLFIALLKEICDRLVRRFIQLCAELNCPLSEEKTEWGSTTVVFLGFLLNSRMFTLSIPVEKNHQSMEDTKFCIE